MSETGERRSVYESVGGMTFFRRRVDAFYRRVEEDEVLVLLYPEDDMDGARERLTLFLGQYWGGPTTYSERRGHPRLGMRHAHYWIDQDARDRWVTHMNAAIDEVTPPEDIAQVMRDYFDMAADAMMNR